MKVHTRTCTRVLSLICSALLIPIGVFSIFVSNARAAADKLYLSDIEWKSWKMYQSSSDDPASPYKPSRNQNEQGGPLTIAGKVYNKGLRTHPDPAYPAEFVYDISGYDYTTFSSTVGKDSLGNTGNVQFFVLADGVVVGESPVLGYGEDYNLACDITGCKTLILRVTDGGDSVMNDSSAWGDAMLSNQNLDDIKPTDTYVAPDDGLTPMEKYASYLADLSKFPISFDYEGVTYRGLCTEHFTEVSRDTQKDSDRESTTITLTHKESGVTVRVEAVCYSAYNAFEWIVYFVNETDHNTGIFSNINGAEMSFWGDEPTVKGIGGDYQNRYTKYSRRLTEAYRINSSSGRPTHDTFPYYNLEYGNGGVFIAVGWPGTFSAEFVPVEKDGKTATAFSAGQAGVNTYLKPGETLRTPLIAFVYYDEPGAAATNVWRNWFIDCNMPTTDTDTDVPVDPLLSASTSWLYGCMTSATEENQMDAIRRYWELGIELDAWWMDAGWYLGANDESISRLEQSGNWKVDTNRFPTSFKDISDLAASYGMETILWFEPELFRLSLAEIQNTNPDFKSEWVLGNLANNGKLTDLGNSEFRDWLFDRVTDIMDNGGITIYRQDFNEFPANVWRTNDSDDRRGITENAYCQGYLAYWDRLLAYNPGSFIDNCASGGGRLDLESMRRSVILHRTDSAPATQDYAEAQDMTAALAEWLVYFGGPTNGTLNDEIGLYELRSVFAPAMTLNYNVHNTSENWELLDALMDEWEIINDYYYADYYELLAGDRSNNKWRAWEYFDTDKGEGFLQVFRPVGATAEEMTLKLQGLDPNKTYVLTDFNQTNSITATGAELMAGYTVKLPEARSAATIFIGAKSIDVPDYETLLANEPKPEKPVQPEIPADATYVSDLPLQSWIMFGGDSSDENPPYRPSIDSGETGPLSIGGVVYEKGLRTHISDKTNTAELVFDISGLDVNRFSAIVGKDAAGAGNGLIQFQLYLDGEKIAESPVLQGGEVFVLNADISGGKTLTLHATDGGDGYAYDSIGWGNAVIYNDPGEDETEPPVDDTEPPVEDTDPPVEDTDPPVEDTDPPVEDTDPSVEPPIVTQKPKKKGCSSVVGFGAPLLLSMLTAAFCLRKKRA